MQRKAQSYLDFVEAENSVGFHAPQEATRILGESAELARQGQLAPRDPAFRPREGAAAGVRADSRTACPPGAGRPSAAAPEGPWSSSSTGSPLARAVVATPRMADHPACKLGHRAQVDPRRVAIFDKGREVASLVRDIRSNLAFWLRLVPGARDVAQALTAELRRCRERPGPSNEAHSSSLAMAVDLATSLLAEGTLARPLDMIAQALDGMPTWAPRANSTLLVAAGARPDATHAHLRSFRDWTTLRGSPNVIWAQKESLLAIGYGATALTFNLAGPLDVDLGSTTSTLALIPLASFQAVYRAGWWPAQERYLALVTDGPPARERARALVGTVVPPELGTILGGWIAGLRSTFPPGPYEYGTDLSSASTSPVVAADIDLVADGCLYEVKCVSSRRGILPEHVIQLVAYFVLQLARFPRRPPPRSIGILNPRYDWVWQERATDLLRRAGVKSVRYILAAMKWHFPRPIRPIASPTSSP